MITVLKQFDQFLGLITQVDSSQVPLGGAISCKNLAQLTPGRLRRIPGVTAASAPAIDASTQIPLSFWAKGLGVSGADQLIAIFIGASTVSVVNLSTGLAMTGPALAAPAFGKPWSYTFYNNKWMFAGGNNSSIYQLDSASAYSAVTGSPSPPAGNLIKAFLDKLYVAASATEGLVYYSDTLTTNFPGATSLINVKEIPGAITALAINSPSTDTQGIDTDLIIAKQSAIWKYNETSKDLISGVVGFDGSSSLVNTEAGLVGLGRKGNRHSIFLMKVGSAGEPADIGEPLRDILSGTTMIANEHLAHAVLHNGFYKLFFSLTGQNANPNEVWLDTESLARDNSLRWYGVHNRGGIDASSAAGNMLELFVRGSAGAAKRFQENTSADLNFFSITGITLQPELDLPLNVDPLNDEKTYDLLELQIAKEANVSGNQATYEPIAEGTSQGVQPISLYNGTSQGISRVAIPVRPAGTSGMEARDARLIIRQTLNQRLDIIGASVQYLIHEDKGGGHVRTKVE